MNRLFHANLLLEFRRLNAYLDGDAIVATRGGAYGFAWRSTMA